MKETIMNQEKLAKLQAQVRIGGKVGAAPGRRWGGRAGHGRGGTALLLLLLLRGRGSRSPAGGEC